MTIQNHDTSPNQDSSLILLVDDEPAFLSLLANYLQRLGFQHKTATNGRDAIKKLENDHFPLIITDINMPEMNGMELIAHVKEHYPESDVMATTGFTHAYSFTDVIKAGAIDYIAKPFTLEEFQAKLNRVIRERSLFKLCQLEIAERKKAEESLLFSHHALEEQVRKRTAELEETNTALRVLLSRRDQEKIELMEDMQTKLQKNIFPYLDKITRGPLSKTQRNYVEYIETNLASIHLSKDSALLTRYQSLTPTELKVANLIRQQKSSKEIADILDVSLGTIQTHREKIRKKLQITHQKKNLYKTLSSLP